MTPKNQKSLKRIKYALTKRMWNEDTSRLKQPQYQGLNQGFRLVGSKTKNGETVTVWKTGERITVEDLVNYIDKDYQIEFKIFEPKMSLEEARKKYPEWYHQRIELGRQKMSWTCNRGLYDWWKTKANDVVEHHRYFYIMSLAIYAIKSGVDFEELEKDAYSFKSLMNKKAPQNLFTEDDIASALEMYQECYKSFPRDEISKISAIEIKPNRRNGRSQAAHLKMARFIRDEVNQNTHWRNGNGRKSVREAVFNFLNLMPNSTAQDFCELTGMSRSVFFKYKAEWKKIN